MISLKSTPYSPNIVSESYALKSEQATDILSAEVRLPDSFSGRLLRAYPENFGRTIKKP
jgi:hypothetical protein